MRPGLRGDRIVLFESSLAEEHSDLVRRSGGVPVCVPAVVERRRRSGHELAALLDVVSTEPAVFVFSSAIGVRALFDEARGLDRGPELLEAIQRGGSVCRGPRAAAALYREGLFASLKARAPYSTGDLVEALGTLAIEGLPVVLVHHGERNLRLVKAMAARETVLLELLFDEWQLPADPAPLTRAALRLAEGDFAAAAFTTQVQARNLLTVASRIGRRDEVIAALRSKVVVAAVGPSCARVMDSLGVPPHVVPLAPRRGAMLEALVDRLASRRAA
jgi:uroporphyrinogen-III synthase